MQRTKFVQKRYAGCPICNSKLRPLLEGSILQGDDLMLLSNRHEISLREIHKHLHHMKAKLFAEVAKDAEEVLASIEELAEKYEEQD